MTHDQFLQDIEQRLTLLEEALHHIREDIAQARDARESRRKDLKRRMAEAAQLLKDDYAHDEELTIFTALDGEDFYEPE